MIRRIGYVLAILLGAGVSLVGPSGGHHNCGAALDGTKRTPNGRYVQAARARRKPTLHHRPTTRPQRLPLGNRLPRLVVGAERHGDYSIRRWRIGRQHFVLCEVRPASSLPPIHRLDRAKRPRLESEVSPRRGPQPATWVRIPFRRRRSMQYASVAFPRSSLQQG